MISVLWVWFWQSTVSIMCKAPSQRRHRVRDVRVALARWMFCSAMNYRFRRMSKQADRPFFYCDAYETDMVNPVFAYGVQASCPEGRTSKALEHILVEVVHITLPTSCWNLRIQIE